MGKPCPEQTDPSCTPMARLIPVDIDLLALARWASLLVSAALAAHERPGELASQVQLLNVAAVLHRMLGRVCLSIEEPARQREAKPRGHRRVGKA